MADKKIYTKPELENTRLNDPVAGNQQAKYLTRGLTYISNNTSIIPRDSAGNIILNESATDNPLLIIDPVAEQITMNSALKILDTRFQYYKFPVTVNANVTEELSTDINFESDIIYARYKPSENRTINSGTTFSGILMDEVEEGLPQKNTNSYYITKEIKNSGKDLLFRIKIQHRFDNVQSSAGTAYFSLMKSGPNYDLVRNWDDFGGGSIGQYEVKTEYYERIVRNSEFEIGDNFNIGALAGQDNDNEYHTINSEQSYWVITDASKNVDEWNQPI